MSDFLLFPANGAGVGQPSHALADQLSHDGFAEARVENEYRLFVRGGFAAASDGRLLLLGDAYDADGGPINQSALDEIVPSCAALEKAASRCWGQFVALAIEARAVRLYRDPSSGQACYMSGRGDAFLAASSVDLLRLATDHSFDVCREGVIRALAYRDLRQDRTAIENIRELPPGCAADSQAEGVRYLWQPLKDWKSGMALSEGEMAERLETALRLAVRAQTAGTRRVMLELSGGLDSSLLALLLADMQIDFAAVTYAGRQTREDESAFAQAVCTSVDRPWRGSMLRGDQIRLHESAAAHLAWPSARLFTQLFDSAAQEAMADLGCDRIMSGGGGDSTFCYLPSSAPLVDCLSHWRTALNAGNVVRDLALAHETTSAEIFWRALRRMSLPRGLSWKQDMTFLSRDVRWSLSRRAFHKGIDLGGAPRGKLDHLRQMIGIHNHLDAYGSPRREALRFPLVSRPVVEAALAIPSWQWFEGGANRAPVRRLLAGRLPAMISARRSKGGFDGVIREIFTQHGGEMKAHLHDGWLAREKIIDVDAVDEEFRRFQESGTGRISRLMALWDVEMWVRAVRRRQVSSLPLPDAASD